MGQVTIYLKDEIEQKMKAAADSAHMSKSKWISVLIQEKVADEWPESIASMAGSWSDFPDLEDLRENLGEDATREQL